MATRSDLLVGRQHQPRVLAAGADATALSRDERVARIQRRRLMSRAAVALESVLWLAGAAFGTAVAIAGISGLH